LNYLLQREAARRVLPTRKIPQILAAVLGDGRREVTASAVA